MRQTGMLLTAPKVLAPLSVLALALLSCGCKSGTAGFPFQSQPSRVPPPATRSFSGNGNYYQNAQPGAVGTGVNGNSNWSSSPGAVGQSGSNGVFTSFLERTGTGYSVKSVPSGATPGNGGTSAPPRGGQPPATSSHPVGSDVEPAQYEQDEFPKSELPASAPKTNSAPSTLNWRTIRS